MAPTIRRKRLLSANRPGIHKKEDARLSRPASRNIIRKHHELNRAIHAAQSRGDEKAVAEMSAVLRSQGGLASYQHASLLGQSNERGGDSSKVLMDWLKARSRRAKQKWRVLEVGALSTRNACSRSQSMSVTRIDLNSQMPGIEKQDFMQRPLPKTPADRFDIVSLSLVLNFVPTKEDRGLMLLRTCDFLDTSSNDGQKPYLFLVLPAACIYNSRYMNEQRFHEIMTAIGYTLSEHKVTDKLVYDLWAFDGNLSKDNCTFGKVEVSSGSSKNNFSIVL